jgi:hypothetical protein
VSNSCVLRDITPYSPVDLHRTSQRHITESGTLLNHRCGNLESYITLYFPEVKYLNRFVCFMLIVWSDRTVHFSSRIACVLQCVGVSACVVELLQCSLFARMYWCWLLRLQHTVQQYRMLNLFIRKPAATCLLILHNTIHVLSTLVNKMATKVQSSSRSGVSNLYSRRLGVGRASAYRSFPTPPGKCHNKILIIPYVCILSFISNSKKAEVRLQCDIR